MKHREITYLTQRINVFLYFLILILISGCTDMSEEKAFSEWRGPGRTGVYHEKGLLQQWPEAGPAMIWSTDGLPDGYSSMSIANDRIYLTGTKDSTDIIIALSTDGEILWQTPYGRSWDDSFILSRSTPTIEGSRAYVSSGLGDIACVDAFTGEIIWSLKASEKYKTTFGNWGIAESLLLYHNKVFYTPGGDSTTIIALDKQTGEEIWMSESLNDEPSYTSPLLIDRNGIRIIVNVTKNYVFAANPDNGDIIWKFNYGEYSNDEGWNIQANTPLYHDGMIYVTNGYNHKSIMLKLSEDISSVSLAWVDTVLDVHHGGAVMIDNYIYGPNWLHNRKGMWVCLDWYSGKMMYETEWHTKGPIIACEGMLYLCDEKDGNVGIAKATPEGLEVVSSFKIPYGEGPYWSHPVIHNKVLYIRHGDALMAYIISE